MVIDNNLRYYFQKKHFHSRIRGSLILEHQSLAETSEINNFGQSRALNHSKSLSLSSLFSALTIHFGRPKGTMNYETQTSASRNKSQMPYV